LKTYRTAKTISSHKKTKANIQNFYTHSIAQNPI